MCIPKLETKNRVVLVQNEDIGAKENDTIFCDWETKFVAIFYVLSCKSR